MSPTTVSQSALVEEGTLRIAPLLALPAVLAAQGIDPWPVIAEAGIDAGRFDDPENLIAFADAGRLLTLAAEHSGCPHFGLLIGERSGLDILGLIGRLAARSANVGSALEDLIQHLHLHDRGAVPALSVDGDQAMLVYTVYQTDIPGIEIFYDAALLIAYNLLKALAGADWQATKVQLCRPQPADFRPYRQAFKAPINFDAEHNAVLFPSTWLQHPPAAADVLAHYQLMQEIEALEALGASELPDQILRVLRRLLTAGADHGETSQGQISQLFALHRRTLNRRLRAHGTSFRELLDTARYDIARQLLRDTRLSIVGIAAALDYADATAFDHAFRRWSGGNPSAWRAAHPPADVGRGD